MNVKVDELAIRLSQVVESYGKEVVSKSMEELEKVANDIIDYIKADCPKGNSTKHLKDSFIKTNVGSGVNKVIYISSKTKGRLVHLVELGFKHRSGKHVPARPFLRPAYDEFTPKMLEDIRKIIEGR